MSAQLTLQCPRCLSKDLNPKHTRGDVCFAECDKCGHEDEFVWPSPEPCGFWDCGQMIHGDDDSIFTDEGLMHLECAEQYDRGVDDE